MFKKDVQPLPDSMLKGITATIDKLEGFERNVAQEPAPAVEAEQEVAQDVKEAVSEEVCPVCDCDPCECEDDDEDEDEDEDEMEESSCGKKHTKEEKELDPVNKKALKKDFKDRKDKDIDNDGDVDDSDKYLHMRRKAIAKALDEKMTDDQKKTAKSLIRLGDKPRVAVKTAKAQKAKDKEFYRKAYEEVEQVEEAYKSPAEAEAFEAGKKAARAGKKYEENPHKKGSPEALYWSKGHNKARTRKEEVELDEARKNQADDLYFDTYSAAVQYAKAKAEKMGYEVDEDDWHNKVTTGPGKPGRGKTTRHNIALNKNGKPTKKGLAIQVYNRDTDKKTYELNSYVS